MQYSWPQSLRWRGVLGVLLLLAAPLARAGLGLNGVIPLPGVRGQFGGLALDAAQRRLFVAVTGNDELLVVDLRSGTVTGKISDLDQPRAVVYLPSSGRLAVSNRGSGELDFYNTDNLAPAGAITFGDDADGLEYDAASGKIYLGYGEGHASGIAVVSSDGLPLMQLPLDSHPAGFAADAGTGRLYVNLPASREIAVFDLASGRRLATWSLGIESGANYAMALDAAGVRLFIATRSPDRLLVLDARSGRVLQTLLTPGDVGDLAYNAASGELYAAGGVGRIAVYTSGGGERLLENGEIHAARGARAALFDPATGRYFLAVPAVKGGVAEIRVYLATAPNRESAP